jgi:hypothetical protein
VERSRNRDANGKGRLPILVAKSQMSKDTNISGLSFICQNYSKWPFSQREDGLPDKEKFQTLFQAILASDTICSVVKDWPSDALQRSSPLAIYALWAPACIQILVKAFATSWELREKSSLSIQSLKFAMKQIADYWGIGQLALGMMPT